MNGGSGFIVWEGYTVWEGYIVWEGYVVWEGCIVWVNFVHPLANSVLYISIYK